ncbi:MAG: apolipoprotein N-acyltransferase [Puniceicoccales bacterium]|jgi:apolipoprotein N-acyltransferase|nr:apolipoprotein N-acyltransferase [Puniceicoccales bacterium]
MNPERMEHSAPADRGKRALPWVVGVLTLALAGAPSPGVDFAEAAWLWAVPFALWAVARPGWRTWLVASAITMVVAKCALLVWLRHVYVPLGYLGLVFVSFASAIFPVLWLALLRWLFPKTQGAPLTARLVIQLGLAGAWVFLEWVQSWFLTGFPWMLLAESQWLRPTALSLCAWGGPWALGFAIMLFNLGLARYVARVFHARRQALPAAAPAPFAILRNVCPEFYLGVAPLFFALFSHLQALNLHRARAEKLFTAAVVQMDFPPGEKWDETKVTRHVAIARELTLNAASGATPPDIILWPEAALPYPVGNAGYDSFLKQLAHDTRSTLLIGAISLQGDGYFNGIHVVTPDGGVGADFYAKRHLVPFGEYVPLADILPLRKVVPIAHDSLVGGRADPLPVPLPGNRNGRPLLAGTLVCYEDVFPALSLDMARRGADFIAVVTNDAWYGREAGAYQHAAHSAVIAASLRLPVVRCGNNGWSGVISPLGQAQALEDATGSIYFRGTGRFDVHGIPASVREPTFYVRHGDWVVKMSALLALWACVRNRVRRRKTMAGHAL